MDLIFDQAFKKSTMESEIAKLYFLQLLSVVRHILDKKDSLVSIHNLELCAK